MCRCYFYNQRARPTRIRVECQQVNAYEMWLICRSSGLRRGRRRVRESIITRAVPPPHTATRARGRSSPTYAIYWITALVGSRINTKNVGVDRTSVDNVAAILGYACSINFKNHVFQSRGSPCCTTVRRFGAPAENGIDHDRFGAKKIAKKNNAFRTYRVKQLAAAENVL